MSDHQHQPGSSGQCALCLVSLKHWPNKWDSALPALAESHLSEGKLEQVLHNPLLSLQEYYSNLRFHGFQHNLHGDVCPFYPF